MLPESFIQQLESWNTKIKNLQVKKGHGESKEHSESVKQANFLALELKYHLGEEFEVYQQLGNANTPKQLS